MNMYATILSLEERTKFFRMFSKNTSTSLNQPMMRCQQNSSSPCITTNPPNIAEWFRVFIYAIFVITFVVGTTSNLILCYTIYRQKRKRRTIHFFTLNLSISDLLVLLVYLPMELYKIHALMTWELGRVPCKIFYGINAATINANILTLIAITRDRYVAVMDPLTAHSRATSSVKKWLIAIWFLSIVICLPLLIVVDVHNRNCFERWPTDDMERVYWIVLFFLQLLLPLIYFTFAYSLILWRMRRDTLPVEVAALYNAMGKCEVTSRNGWNTKRKKQQMKLLKLASTLVVAYVICVSPQHAVFFAVSYKALQVHDEIAIYVFLISNFLLIFNSLINPVIFGLQSREMQKILSGFFCRWKPFNWKKVDSGRLLMSISSNMSNTSSSYSDSTVLPVKL